MVKHKWCTARAVGWLLGLVAVVRPLIAPFERWSLEFFALGALLVVMLATKQTHNLLTWEQCAMLSLSRHWFSSMTSFGLFLPPLS